MSVPLNRRYHMPRTWMSREHFALWIEFLHQRCRAGDITFAKLREKILAASRNYRAQLASNGRLPDDDRPPDMQAELLRHYAQEIQCKAANG